MLIFIMMVLSLTIISSVILGVLLIAITDSIFEKIAISCNTIIGVILGITLIIMII